MNAIQQQLARGVAFLQQKGPQAEQFRLDGGSEVVSANCNWLPKTNDPQGMRDVSTKQGTIIEWPLGKGMPEVGSLLVDSNSYTHRVIRPVQHIGHALRLECEVTR